MVMNFRGSFARSALILALLLLTLAGGCSGDTQRSDRFDEIPDVGVDADVDSHDHRPPDAAKPEPDSELADDSGDADTSYIEPEEPPADAPAIGADFLRCEHNFDCPINGSSCVKELSFNRTDSDGTESIPLSDLFEDLQDGEGLCTRNCGSDPTICDTVWWADQHGIAQPSTCFVVATGVEPYQRLSSDEFEVQVDLHEVEEGQAFGAICRPPFEKSASRSESFCHNCSQLDDCSPGSICFNSLSEEARESADELGTSFCVEACNTQSDCPFGFRCASVGDNDENYCLPLEDTCSDCVDRDEDGFGTGHCGPDGARQTAFDCDDRNPQAYFDPRNPAHPFPDHCYDDPNDLRSLNDLNCNGVPDFEEQIGPEGWPEEHCTACGDSCSGATEGGHRLCQFGDDGEPYCGLGCAPGLASCGTDIATGCTIIIEDELDTVGDDRFSEPSSPYIWFDAAPGEEWAHRDAQAHFFCNQHEARQQLDNPVQKRGCHADGDPQAHPGLEQTCVGFDMNCDGKTGLETDDLVDELEGVLVQVGDQCEVPGQAGACQAGVVQCTVDGMECEQLVFAKTTPICSDNDTTCSGRPDSEEEEFLYNNEEIIFLNEHGEELQQTPQQVVVGQPCRVPGLKGQCAIGEVQCGGALGLVCTQVNFPEREKPGFDGIDHSCDGADRYLNSDGEPHVIYVHTGDQSPSLSEAITLAADCDGLELNGETLPCDIFVQDSSQLFTKGPIELIEGVHIYGGFDVATWDMSDEATFAPPNYEFLTKSSKVTVTDTLIADAKTHIGLIADGIEEETAFFGVHIQTTDQTNAPCVGNIAGFCRECEGMYFKAAEFTAGSAGAGTDGDPGSPGGDGSPGVGVATSGRIEVAGGNGAYKGGTSHLLFPTSGEPWGRGGEGGVIPEAGDDGHADDPPNLKIIGSTGISTLHPYLATTCDKSITASLNNTTIHGAGGGGAHALPVSDDGKIAFASGGGGAWGGQPGYTGVAGAPSIGFVLINTKIDDNSGIRFESTRFWGGNGGFGGDGGDGGKGGQGGKGGRRSTPNPDLELIGGDGGNGAGAPGAAGGNGGASIGLIRINSIVGPSPGFNASAGAAGQGGIGGMGGVGPGNADNGPNGPPGETGLACDQLLISAEHNDWELKLTPELNPDNNPTCTWDAD